MSTGSAAHICQNCGADLKGEFCSNCGQKGSAAYDRSLKSIVVHFFEEIFVWDSRFFRSLKYLFTRPGYLTHEYISGRIKRYISPLKMFLFTSFVLFFVMVKADPDQYTPLTEGPREEYDLVPNFILEQQEKSSKPAEMFIADFNSQMNDNITLYIFGIMFVFSALLLAVYFPKKIYYTEHIVFTLHFFTFVLWCFLFAVFLGELSEFFIWFFLYLVPAVYLVISLKRVYHKTKWKALIAGGFLAFCYWMLVTCWALGTIFISAVRAA